MEATDLVRIVLGDQVRGCMVMAGTIKLPDARGDRHASRSAIAPGRGGCNLSMTKDEPVRHAIEAVWLAVEADQVDCGLVESGKDFELRLHQTIK
jgi:hypothetical protein